MNELAQLVLSVHGPIPHMCLFGTIACILGWWTKEVRATMLLMTAISVGGECLQLAWPDIFQFQFEDIMWNLIGSALGILLAQIGTFVSSELWMKREKDWDQIKGDVRRGNYT